MSNYKSYLRKQPTYDEITGYIHFGQERITYPDRSATFMRDSPYLGLYDGMGMQELEDQEQQMEKEKLKEIKVREVASETQATRAVVEMQTQTNAPTVTSSGTQSTVNTTSSEAQTDPIIFDMTVDDNQDNYLHYLAAEKGINKKVLKKNKAKILKIVKRHLGTEVDTLPYMPNNTSDIADDATVDYEDRDDRDTVNYGSDIDVDDVVFQNRVDKRKQASEEKAIKKIKTQSEKKPTVKQEGLTTKKGVKKDNTLLKKKDDDDVQISGMSINRNTDMDFWNETSAREMRNQLNLRFPGKKGDWDFKTRVQLLDIIKDKIKRGRW